MRFIISILITLLITGILITDRNVYYVHFDNPGLRPLSGYKVRGFHDHIPLTNGMSVVCTDGIVCSAFNNNVIINRTSLQPEKCGITVERRISLLEDILE
jgi:hypothetical protein